jgi:hypothetical protein
VTYPARSTDWKRLEKSVDLSSLGLPDASKRRKLIRLDDFPSTFTGLQMPF